MNQELKPTQAGGIFHTWQSPDGKFKHHFTKLDLSCKPDNYPGIAIVAEKDCRKAVATAVKRLGKELPQLLNGPPGTQVAYWLLQQDESKIRTILTELTNHPVFIG